MGHHRAVFVIVMLYSFSAKFQISITAFNPEMLFSLTCFTLLRFLVLCSVSLFTLCHVLSSSFYLETPDLISFGICISFCFVFQRPRAAAYLFLIGNFQFCLFDLNNAIRKSCGVKYFMCWFYEHSFITAMILNGNDMNFLCRVSY